MTQFNGGNNEVEKNYINIGFVINDGVVSKRC